MSLTKGLILSVVYCLDVVKLRNMSDYSVTVNQVHVNKKEQYTFYIAASIFRGCNLF